MKLSYEGINTIISFEKSFVIELIIENQKLFRTFIEDISKNTNENESNLVLSKNNKIISSGKNIEQICDISSFDINKKHLLTKIINKLEKIAINDEYYLKTQELLNNIQMYLEDLSYECDFSVEFSKIIASSIIKMSGLKLQDDYINNLEKIMDYMDIIREFDGNKLFVLVNLRSYYQDEEIKMFINEVGLKKHYVLLLEPIERTKLNCTRLVIDSDLCEF